MPTKYERNYLAKILQEETLSGFRFFGECRKLDFQLNIFGFGSESPMYMYSDRYELCECRLKNLEYGKIDIIPMDYPAHEKYRMYLDDVFSMFERGTFVRKTIETMHIETITEKEYITPLVYIEHVGQIIAW